MQKFLFKALTSEETLQILMSNGLIKDSMHCTYCLQPMDIKSSNDNSEKFNWRCMNTLCIHYQTTQSIRVGSFFQNFQAPIMEILRCIYYYSTLPRQTDIV